MDAILDNREHAGHVLSRKLAYYQSSSAVVVGIPHGGVVVAAALAEALSLPLEVMPCRKIRNPANSEENIGSVSEDEVFLHDCARSIPQDFLHHKIRQLQRCILQEKTSYYDSRQPLSFRHRPVILVDDLLTSADTMMACLRSIRKQRPLEIVIAVALAEVVAARDVSAEADDFKCIKIEQHLAPPDSYFKEFLPVTEAAVRHLMQASVYTLRHFG